MDVFLKSVLCQLQKEFIRNLYTSLVQFQGINIWCVISETYPGPSAALGLLKVYRRIPAVEIISKYCYVKRPSQQ